MNRKTIIFLVSPRFLTLKVLLSVLLSNIIDKVSTLFNHKFSIIQNTDYEIIKTNQETHN